MNSTHGRVFQTPFFFIDELPSERSGGLPHYRLTGPDSAIVMVFNELGEILLVRQFRPTLDETTLEFPAGSIEVGESPIQGATREVVEETGYEPKLFQLADYFHLMMNRTNIKDYLFCGVAIDQKPREPETGIDHEWVSRESLRDAALGGDYRQLAGLGILLLASEVLGVNVLSCSVDELLGKILLMLHQGNRGLPSG